MRVREQEIGNCNLIGKRVEQKRKERAIKQKDLLQRLKTYGLHLNSSALSKLEGQIRKVSDVELVALSKALDVSVDWLLGLDK